MERKYVLRAANLRSALSLADDNVRAAVAWQFTSIFSVKDDGKEGPPVEMRWKEVGHRFFAEVWPLEPSLQSPASANDFARIPASVGPQHFADAVSTIAPFLVPFRVWSVESEFDLQTSEDWTKEIARMHAEELVTLLSLSIGDEQGNRVFDLGSLLDQLLIFHPELQGDYRIQRLRTMAA
jgi:hypothetical protein